MDKKGEGGARPGDSTPIPAHHITVLERQLASICQLSVNVVDAKTSS